jgi:hypothetical protein
MYKAEIKGKELIFDEKGVWFFSDTRLPDNYILSKES